MRQQLEEKRDCELFKGVCKISNRPIMQRTTQENYYTLDKSKQLIVNPKKDELRVEFKCRQC